MRRPKIGKNLPLVLTKQLFLPSSIKTSGSFFQKMWPSQQSWTLLLTVTLGLIGFQNTWGTRILAKTLQDTRFLTFLNIYFFFQFLWIDYFVSQGTTGIWHYIILKPLIGNRYVKVLKGIYGLLTSPRKEQTNLICLVFTLHGKQNKFACFYLGESTACQSAFRNYLCIFPIHVVTFTLISNLATYYIQKRTG